MEAFTADIAHYGTAVLGTAAATLMIFFIKTIVVRSRKLLAGFAGFFAPVVNVSYLSADNRLLSFRHVRITLHNGGGGLFEARQGIFFCNANYIQAGKHVQVDIQDGLWQEDLIVKIDPVKDVLYVSSQLTYARMVDRINGNNALPAVSAQ